VRTLILAPFSERALARLRTRVDVTYESWLDTDRIYDPEQLGERLARDRFRALVVEADFVFEETFDAAPDLRFVGICRNALNHVALDAASAHGVAVSHSPGRNTNAVAEMTLGLMLSLLRRIPQANSLVRGAGWRDPSFGSKYLLGREIAGSTIGVVGAGQIGREVVRTCVALGAAVLVHDPRVTDGDVRGFGAEPASLDQITGAAGVITLHVPDAADTRHLVDAPFLAKMRADAYLINTSGGSVVDPRALVEALEAGSIAGAALDVFEGQPLPQSSPLLTAPNLLLTPHIGGATGETIERHSGMIASEIERMLDGQPLRHVVNPDYELARAR
jgi:D-3-phosphoglycerate dehydrogenase